MPKKEIRVAQTEFELRQDNEEEKIVGYAAMFNSPAEETNGFIEEIASGAFGNAIQKSDTRALINHKIRTIVEVSELFDVSHVTFPWYKNTESGLKSREDVLQEYRDKQKADQKENKDNLDIYKKKLKSRERL